jgi:parvulin-like peptidyl-prolyl cis-trans isomerase-like protein
MAATATATTGGSLRGMSAQPAATSVPEEPMILAPPASMADGPTPDARSQAGTPGTSPALSVPTTLARPGGPMPDIVTQPNAMTPAASVQPSSGPGAVASPGAGTLAPMPVFSPASVPSDPAVSPSASQAQGPSARGASVAAPRPRRGDPLLGPNPDLMPELPPLPDKLPAAKPAAAPSSAASPTAANPGPPLEPVAPPAGGPASPPPDLGPPAADLGPPTGDNRPASPTRVAEMPMPEVTPASGRPLTTLVARPAATAPETASTTTRRDPSRRDTQIVRTSLQRPIPEARTTSLGPDAKSADQIAAEIGNEVITKQDLIIALNEFCKDKKISLREIPEDEQNHVIRGVLRNLIERTLLVQEAKHIIKTKQFDQFMDVADKVWREEQLPPLEYHYAVTSEPLLRERLKEQGVSLETMHQTFRQYFIAENFLHEKIKDKLKVELPDLLKYYSEHVRANDFDRPAQITWRELVVEVGKYPSRDVARQKANSLYEKLRRGANFDQLARSESDGPTSSRDQGGLMQTSPGAYAVPVVNEALLSLPIGQVSGILDGENSFHVVKVEERRAAGPASFEEVQDQIRSALLEKKFQEERAAYIDKLRQKAFIRSMFDGTENDPERETQ